MEGKVRSCLVLFFMLGLSFRGFAQQELLINSPIYQVEKIKTSSVKTIIKGDMKSLRLGDQLEYRDELNQVCRGFVESITQGYATLSLPDRHCVDKGMIKTGALMKLVSKSNLSRASSDERIAEPIAKGTNLILRDNNKLPTINEMWYILWGFGLSQESETYGSGLISNMTQSRNMTSGINGDLGVYWPSTNHKRMYGLIVNFSSSYSLPNPEGQADRHREGLEDEVSFSSASHLSIDEDAFSLSVHHFFGKNIGDGWFLRGDIGVTNADVYYVINKGGQTVAKSENKDGYGLLFGGGYALRFGKETRLLFGLYASSKQFDSENLVRVQGNISLLF